MAKPVEDRQPEALATFSAAARNKGNKPADQGPETEGRAGDLDAEEKDAADILDAGATGDTKKKDAAIARRIRGDKRAG